MTTSNVHHNVILLISNQSLEVNPVDITIKVNEKLILEDSFYVQGEQPVQHNWQQHKLHLANGEYQLSVSSQKGQASVNTSLLINGEHKILIAFWKDNQDKGKLSKAHFSIQNNTGSVGLM
jgi:hypothetical protein